MTLFGDLDVSTLRDLPPGRQTVHTYLAGDERRERWWEFVRKKLNEGRQAYVVVPLVEESEQSSAASVQAAYEALANGELEAYRIGMIHGRMTSEEKDAVMERFRSGGLQVLVATSLVEVGVDVPNATRDDDRKRRAFRAGATAPASRADQPRQASGLLLRLHRAADRGIGPAAQSVRVVQRRLSACRDRLPPPRSWRVVRHARSTACRRCGLPISSGTRSY